MALSINPIFDAIMDAARQQIVPEEDKLIAQQEGFIPQSNRPSRLADPMGVPMFGPGAGPIHRDSQGIVRELPAMPQIGPVRSAVPGTVLQSHHLPVSSLNADPNHFFRMIAELLNG